MMLAQQDSAESTLTEAFSPGGQTGVLSPCRRKKHFASKWPTSHTASLTSKRSSATRCMGMSNQSRPKGVSWRWTLRMISARAMSAWPRLVLTQAEPCIPAGSFKAKVRTSPLKHVVRVPGAGS